MALDTQIMLVLADTGHLYSNREKYLHTMNAKYRQERRFVKNKTIETEKKLASLGYTAEDIKQLRNRKLDKVNIIPNTEQLVDDYISDQNLIIHKRQKAHESKDKLLKLLENKTRQNELTGGKDHVRVIRDEDIHDSNIVATFTSALTRAIGAEQDKLTDEIFSLQIYYYDVFKDAMLHGCEWKGERYVYLTSSAGQIRKKRAVFIKEKTWNAVGNKLLCGLTPDIINAKGGCNPNKYLSYLALTNSATDVWTDFDIDKSIVVDDYEVGVHGTVDFIDDLDYSIKRKEGDFDVSHCDGAGMILPNAFDVEQKTAMVRAPWLKGLLAPFDYLRFIDENNCSPVIEDIWGKKHDIIAEDIQIIFTKSQLKMWKYYDSWEQYKDFYKMFNCECGRCNEEEEHIRNATLNYQMLQQAVDFTEEELTELVSRSAKRVANVCRDLDTIKDIMGIGRHNEHMSNFQKCLKLYPSLLNDTYTKDVLRDIKDSLVKQYRAGKLSVNGKYTFVLPDFYAACQHWFLGIEKPDGLLEDGEVFCDLFHNYEKIVCMRSPSLYHETPVQQNVACDKYGERYEYIKSWFNTKSIYTSVKSLITRILQLDDLTMSRCYGNIA